MSGRSGGFAISITATDAATKTIDGINKRLAALSAPAEKFNRALSKFGDVSGVGRVAESVQNLGRSSLDAFRSLDRMAGPLAAITSAGSIAGIIEYSRRWGELGNRLEQLSYRLGAPVDRLTALEKGARLAGSSSDALDSGLRSLGDTLSGATWGRDPHAVQLFNSLGVAFKDANGSARQATDVLGDVADAIQKLPDPRTQARVTRELFGGDDLLPFLRHGRQGIKEYTEEAQRLGGVITPEMADRATKLWHSVGEVETAAGGVANAVADKLAPAVTRLNEKLAEWAARNKDVVASGLLEWLDKISGWVERHPQLTGALLGGVAGWRTFGPLGAAAGAVVGSAPGGPFQAPLPANLGEGAGEEPFSWWRPWTWLHHASSSGAPSVSRNPGGPAAGMQANNPGNLMFAGQSDATGFMPLSGGRKLAVFPDMATGVAADLRQLQTYQDRDHLNTVRQLVTKWVSDPNADLGGAGPGNPKVLPNSYIGDIDAGIGVGPDDPIDMHDPRVAAAFLRAQQPHESGPTRLSDADIQGGVAQATNGHVQVDVHLHGAPAGTTANVASSGPVRAPPPRVDTSMPLAN